MTWPEIVTGPAHFAATCPVCGWARGTDTAEHSITLMELHKAGCPGPGVKADAGKPRPDLLPPRALIEVSRVLEFGARKYAPDNWRKVEGWRWRYTAAALRHLFAWMGGEGLDRESGLHHLAHAACCVLFLLDLEVPRE